MTLEQQAEQKGEPLNDSPLPISIFRLLYHHINDVNQFDTLELEDWSDLTTTYSPSGISTRKSSISIRTSSPGMVNVG